MDLKEFVTQTILQIVEGVKDAQEQAPAGALINPRPKEGGRFDRSIHKVEFDVAVTASSEAEAKAGAGVVIAAIGLGTHGRKSEESTSISHIRFDVAMSYPRSEQHTHAAARPTVEFDPT